MKNLSPLKNRLKAAERKLDLLERNINSLEKEWEETDKLISELNFQIESNSAINQMFKNLYPN